MTRVVVTGASGFVGGFVVRALRARGAVVAAPGRSVDASGARNGVLVLEPASSPAQMRAALQGAWAVVHLAAAVHDVRGRTSAEEYARVNRDYPLELAKAARDVGVDRFVFASTIKVNGEGTRPGEAFDESSPPDPHGAYAESKWQAEEGLRELGASQGLRTRIVRPPLVYGPGVRANFGSLLRWVKSGVPLPFAGFRNRRSFIYVENLADVFARLTLDDRDPAMSRTYLVTDEEDVSTAELVRRMARAFKMRARLFYVPESVLRAGLRALRKEAMADRLITSLRVDGGLARREFAGGPRFSLDDGLSRTAEWLVSTS